MTNILLVAATTLELQALEKELRPKTLGVEINYFVYQVGIPLSMYYLHTYLHTHKVDWLICIGIAGSFKKAYPLGSVVVVERDCFGDMGACNQEGFQSLFEMGWLQANQFPFQNEWLVNSGSHLAQIQKETGILLVRGVTVQQMTDDRKRIDNLQQKYNADIESMEGASVHFLCLMHDIPFLQIRALSNEVGERNKTQWRIQESLEALCDETKKIIKDFFPTFT